LLNVVETEQEPNNLLGQANAIAIPGQVTGAIEKKGDIDWYTFMATAQGQVTFELGPVPKDMDINLTLKDANGVNVAGGSWVSDKGKVGAVSMPIIQPGQYILAVNDGHHNQFSSDPYRINLTWQATADRAEPNDLVNQATEVILGETIQASLYPRGDVDRYRFTAPHQGELSISVSNVADTLDLVFRVLDTDQVLIPESSWFRPTQKGHDTIGTIDIPKAGVYLIELRDNHNNAADINPYQLQTHFVASADQFEPNQHFSQAVNVAVNSEVELTLLPKSDVDWFKVTVDHPGDLEVSLSNVADHMDAVFRIVDSNKELIAGGGWFTPTRKGGDTQGHIALPAAGEYFIEVADNHHNARDIQAIKMRITFVSTLDQGEPNNTASSASSIDVNVVWPLSILPKGDHDWLRYDALSAGALSVSLANVPADHSLVFRVLDENLKVLSGGGWVTPARAGADTLGEVDLPTAGPYFIEVADNHNRHWSSESAELLLKFVAVADEEQPNNSVSTAVVIDAGSAMATILPKGDVDWYSFTMDKPGDVSIDISNVAPQLDVVFRVFNEHLKVVKGGGWFTPPRKGGDTSGTVTLDKAGQYFIEVRDSHNNARSTQEFKIKLVR